MPPTPVSRNPIVVEHYAAQLGLAMALDRALRRLDGSSRFFLDAVTALVQQFSLASLALGADYYTDLRAAANVDGLFSPPVIDPPSAPAVRAYLDAANRSVEAEMEDFAKRLMLNVGTQEIFTAVKADPKRPRWARVTRPGACAFCLMLATRGAAYRTEDTASFRPHKKCQCDVEVSWTEYELPAHVRDAQRLYSEAIADLPRGADRFNAFRRAIYAERKPPR